jgi:hypothetical protein
MIKTGNFALQRVINDILIAYHELLQVEFYVQRGVDIS